MNLRSAVVASVGYWNENVLDCMGETRRRWRHKERQWTEWVGTWFWYIGIKRQKKEKDISICVLAVYLLYAIPCSQNDRWCMI